MMRSRQVVSRSDVLVTFSRERVGRWVEGLAGVWGALVFVLGFAAVGCQGESSDMRGASGPYRLVRFVEAQGEGNIALVSGSRQGGLQVSRSGLGAWDGDDLWLLGRDRLLALREDQTVEVAPVCQGASALLHVGNFIFVSCPKQGRVDLFDAKTLELVQRIEACQGASQMAGVPSGRTVFVRCRDGLGILAGWVPSESRGAGWNILLWSRNGDLTALSEEGLFLWSYPGLPMVSNWEVMGTDGRDLIAVGRRIHVSGDLEVQGDSEFSVSLELVTLGFGAAETDVTAKHGALNVSSLARSGLGDAAWDPMRRALLVPLPQAHEVVAVSGSCLARQGDHPLVRSACGSTTRVGGVPGAVLVTKSGEATPRPMVWDRSAETLWGLTESGFAVLQSFGGGCSMSGPE